METVMRGMGEGSISEKIDKQSNKIYKLALLTFYSSKWRPKALGSVLSYQQVAPTMLQSHTV